MFASAEAIDAKIDTVTGELALAQVADLHRVGQSAGRLDEEVGEDRVLRIGVGDLERFLARAEPAFVDFVGVGSPPVVEGGDFDVVRFLREICHKAMILTYPTGSTRSYFPLFTVCWRVVHRQLEK